MPSSARTTIAERYQISGEPVGQGGMGIVYKAYDTVTKRYVALKTMRGALDSAALELFSREWTVLSQLNHPNIVDIFDTGEFEEGGQRKPFFVMPFLPGRTLDYLIKNASQRLTVERVIEIMMQTCRGLQAAHESGLIHRDLKPSNIFVMEDDTVKIIDFGVVHLAGSDTVTGFKGTLQYMAPEQVEMKPSSPASDIFSLAVVCYEALTGRKPFARGSDTETAEALRNHIPPPVSELNPLVTQLVSRVIHKAMAKAPYHRFSTAREFAETLQKALNNQPIERFDKSKTQPRIERARKAQAEGDLQFAFEILQELEAEGHIDPEMTVLKLQINQAIRQKSIRQLLESARTRREEDELPLALQRIQEVLAIDPDNADALALRSDIEKQSGERQIQNWFRLVEQHIHHHSFTQAREALEQVLKLDANNARACEMLLEVGRREQEIHRLRAEKEHLYQAAVSNYERGEISTALSKLERVLEFNRTAPDSATPDRDAQYQGLYNQIRSERDAARAAYGEGRRCLADKSFDRALEICESHLKRFPNDPLFQALKLEAEENKRQEHSSFIAEVVRRAEAEPDLDRRVNILKEAADRYPDEAHFQQSLRLTRERRDLVNAIVAKARQYEDRGQFGEALGQWDILRNIYAQYPAIEFEVERLTRRHDDQVKDEAKARWVEQIDQARAAGDFGRARDTVRAALIEFPGDRELTGLDKLTQQDLERAKEAEVWLQQGQKLCFERSFGEGLEALRKAAVLNNSNPVIRAALLNALVEQARSVLGRDWRAAEPLIQQALSMEAAHPLAKSLQGLVLDYKRKEIVEDNVSAARDLQAVGDIEGALRRVEEALERFPNELRLAQLRSTLKKSLQASASETPAGEEEPAHAEAPMAKAASVSTGGPSVNLDLSVLERSAVDESVLHRSEDRTVLVPAQSVPAKPAGATPQKAVQTAPPAPGFLSKLRTLLYAFTRWGAFAVFPVALLVVIWHFVGGAPPSPPPLRDFAFDIKVQPAIGGAEEFFDGKQVSEFPSRIPGGHHKVEAGAVGYRAASQEFDLPGAQGSPRSITLQLSPEPLRVRLASDLKTGQVVVDSAPPIDLQDGAFANEALSLSSEHKLTLTQSGKEFLSLSFSAQPGEKAVVASPLKASNLSVVVVSNLGPTSVIYSSDGDLRAGLANETSQPIPPTGLELSNLSAGSQVVLVNGNNSRPLPIDFSNAPGITLLLTSDPNTVTLQVELSVPDTDVMIKGGRTPRHVRGTTTTYQLPPTTYTIIVSKDGYNTEQRTIELKKGEVVRLPRIDLTPVIARPPTPPPPSAPTVSSLIIEGGTAGAEVLIDGQSVGSLDANGALTRDKIPPGAHTIVLRKPTFEDKQRQGVSFAAGQNFRLADADATLIPFGAIAFQITPVNATISYQAANESQPHAAVNGSTVQVRQGSYSVTALAPNFNTQTQTISVSPGTPRPVTLNLSPKEAPCSNDPAAWSHNDGGWDVHKGSGLGRFCRNAGLIQLQIKRPKKHIEWSVDVRGDKERIDYRLSGNEIEQKVVVGGKGKGVSQKLQMGSGDVWNIEINIQQDKISVSSEGMLLDEYKRPDPSVPLGAFGFRGDVELKSPNQK